MMRKLHESMIPSLRGKSVEDLRKWAAKGKGYHGDKKRKEEVRWVTEGGGAYAVEIEKNFGPEFFKFTSKKFVDNGGKIKIVSFGGGKLFSLVELYDKLVGVAKTNELDVDIQIIDYSLTKKLSKDVNKETDDEKLVKKRKELLDNGILRVHIGPLEVRDIADAEGADVMISRQGPFYHGDSERERREMVKKAVDRLVIGGRAYFDVDLPECWDEPSATIDLRHLKSFLGDDFDVVVQPKIDYKTRNWLNITRVDDAMIAKD